LGDPLPGKTAHRAVPGVVVKQGNHFVFAGDHLARSAPAPITILHFPVRSRAQYFNKIAKGGAAYARNTELDYLTGKTWRKLYEELLSGNFDQVFDSELHSEERIAAGLATGELVRDRRLIDALAYCERLASDAAG
jgi:hypothetical protein